MHADVPVGLEYVCEGLWSVLHVHITVAMCVCVGQYCLHVSSPFVPPLVERQGLSMSSELTYSASPAGQ